MNYKKIIITLLTVFFTIISAKPVDVETAKSIAQNYSGSIAKTRAIKELSLAYTKKISDNKLRSNDNSAAYYIFNTGNGFVVVAGDDKIKPILGFSENGDFDKSKISPNLNYWLNDHLFQEIIQVSENNEKQSPKVKMHWDNLSANSKSLSTDYTPNTFLLTTKWGQSSPYNDSCPILPTMSYPSVTGCGATAMAQIMKYHNYPKSGEGQSNEYTLKWSNISDTYVVKSINFAEAEYDWENMLDFYSYTSTEEQKAAVAKLLYHCGAAIKTSYNGSESSSKVSDIESALKTHFKYDKSISLIQKSIPYVTSYTNEEWDSMLKEQIDNKLPVLYSGQGSYGGHAFICDGYNDEGLFHFNWGWNGSDDGWFVTSALNPSYYSFNSSQYIIINIKPIPTPEDEVTISLDIPDEGFEYCAEEISPDVECKIKGEVLNSDSYDIFYENNRNAGKATVRVTVNAGTHEGITKSASFDIRKKEVLISMSPKELEINTDDTDWDYPVLMSGYYESDGLDVFYIEKDGYSPKPFEMSDLQIDCDYYNGDNAGIYPITIFTDGTLTADNYEIIFDDELYLVVSEADDTPISDIKKSDNTYGIKFTKNIVSDKARISVILPDDKKAVETKIVIYDMTGNVVFASTSSASCFVWDLQNQNGRFVANGTYLVIAEVENINGNRYYYSAKLGVKR